ncbi:MAG: NAD(P)H-binding protein [Cyclobacteriaceae bacterium]|nr:NAD(P)H-binding protein [Cyclobacteriaceae bacterium]
MAKVALLAGTTGLIGSQLLEILLADDHYSSVVAISRRPLGKSHPKLTNIVCELSELTESLADVKADDIFCCLGTTMRLAKTKEAFRAVDYDAPLALGRVAKQNGATQYLIVSALGSNKNSSIFYNKVKGEVEEAIDQIGFKSFHVLQPSLLTGSRKEQRTGEGAAQTFYKIFDFFIPKKYAAIESIKVARALLAFAKQGQLGKRVHSSAEMQDY